MFDWVLIMPLETNAFVNMWKENICNLQSTPCGKVWNRVKMKGADNFF